MIRTQFHARSDAGRRGESLPVRLRFASRRGVTLVELMISMLILTIVCIACLQIIGIQSARKEARRREAVERLSVMMDAFIYKYRASVREGSHHVVMNRSTRYLDFVPDNSTNDVHAVFDDGVSPIGYQLCVVRYNNLPYKDNFDGWNTSHRWLVGRLYDQNGAVANVGKPFFTLPVCLGL